MSDWLQPPPSRSALKRTQNQGNQLPPQANPGGSPAPSSRRKEIEDELWAEELADVKRLMDDMDAIHRDTALDELRHSRRTGDRFAMMRQAVEESVRIPTNRSVAFGVLTKDNEAAVTRTKAAHRAATATTASASAGRKRKASSLQDDMDDYKQSLPHIKTSGMHVDLDCDQVRARINKVVDSGVMKKTEFCDAIGASNAAVNAFLKKPWGPLDGANSKAFYKAWDWFKQREIAGLKLPNVNKRRQTEAARAAADRPANTGASAGANLGEETDEVPIHDTCDVAREKIDEHLATCRVSQAQFCRDIHAHGLNSPTRCKGIQPKQLTEFRHKNGSNAGATSIVFYAAYVYFEKIRLAQDQPKSKFRLEMEKRWPDGFDRKHDDRMP
ncbi:hypothetical protein PG996_010937 [Apiospora saccharicola]|uniref:DUF7726 domain-containing protein n=1 Tax=Apiospora saccharicola TaxID=335842 RepID=A0ABR1UDP4_9PEZI